MHKGMKASLALAALACAIGAAWMTQGVRAAGEPTTHAVEPDPRVELRVPAALSGESPQPFALDAAQMRSAVRDGELRVALPDGTSYPIRIERQYTDDTQRWHVVGRAQTRVGPQAMVLTFGADAVFGILPMPDGRLLHVTTMPGGKVQIAHAGDMIPPGIAPSDANDIRYPPRELPEPQVATPKPTKPQTADSRPVRISPPSGPTPPIATGAIAAATPASAVRIDVLALYSQELVAFRGSVAAAETEVANLFAIANQAHVDSGTMVTLRAVGLRQVQVEPAAWNEDLLDSVRTSGLLSGLDVETLRDNVGGDLVTVIRPWREEDPTCGVAWIANRGARRNNYVEPRYAYSVVDVGDCSPYTLAHELGHSLGSAHDRATSTDADGTLHYGAYAFSFGHRNKDFATIMAYPTGDTPHVGYFSNPRSSACGAPCGVQARMDNVRSIQLMAPTIAAFRGTKNTASLLDVEILESKEWRNKTVYVPIILSGVVNSPGAGNYSEYRVEVVGGTATRDVDYSVPILSGDYPHKIIADGRVAYAEINITGDDLVEGPETIQLRLVSNGIPVSDANAVVTIVDDDPRAIVRGNLWFPPGMARPGSVQVNYVGSDGEEGISEAFMASAPDYAYEISAPYGAPLRFEMANTRDFAFYPQFVHEVATHIEKPLQVTKTWKLSGQVKAAPGTTLPTYPFFINIYEWKDGKERVADESIMVSPPDFRFSIGFAPGSSLEIESAGRVENASQYYTWLEPMPANDTTFNPTFSTKPTLYAFGPINAHADSDTGVIVAISDYPSEAVTFRWRTVDGTAKAGKDYVAASGTATIDPYYGYTILDLRTLPDLTAGRPGYFDVVIDRITGASSATGTTTTVRTWIADRTLKKPN